MIAINKELNIPGFIALNWNENTTEQETNLKNITNKQQTD